MFKAVKHHGNHHRLAKSKRHAFSNGIMIKDLDPPAAVHPPLEILVKVDTKEGSELAALGSPTLFITVRPADSKLPFLSKKVVNMVIYYI
jgi:hypothetical protein